MIRRMCGMAVLCAALAVGSQTLVAQSAGSSDATGTQTSQIDLNQASALELQSLPGVGPRTAERIVQYRQEHDGFKKIEELMNVRGIGEKSFLKLKDLITVTPPKTERTARSPQA